MAIANGLMSKKLRKNGYYAAFDYVLSESSSHGDYYIHVYFVYPDTPVLMDILHTTQKTNIENTVKTYLDKLACTSYGENYSIETSVYHNGFSITAWYGLNIVGTIDLFVDDLDNGVSVYRACEINERYNLTSTALQVCRNYCEQAIIKHRKEN